MEKIGNYWNDKDLEIYEIEGKRIVLNKFDGEKYYDCFELAENLIDILSEDRFEVEPIYKEIKKDEFKVIDYKIIREIKTNEKLYKKINN